MQRPTDKLPIGITTDPMHSFISSRHSLHMGTNLSSPAEAEPLQEAAQLDYKHMHNK